MAYRKSWKAVNTMLEEGRSYSGYERNTAFLNMGTGRDGSPQFADISGACGLDLLDDGRANAVLDWDCDGKLDFWSTSRTAPRLRLQHNRSRHENHFLSVKLEGTTCNRDAIGARVSLIGPDGNLRAAKTVRAGEGYLAQSSKWLHFGLAAATDPGHLEIRWPGGKTKIERIRNLTANRFLLVKQGDRKAREWTPPGIGLADVQTVKSQEGRPTASGGAARIVLASRLPLPTTTFIGLDGRERALTAPRSKTSPKPILINLWATWCAPCLFELREWKRERDRLEALDLDVLALSIDQLDSPVAERRALVSPVLKRLGFPFEAGLANTTTLGALEVISRSLVDKHDPLPLPCSFLVDADGRVAVIYRGKVSAAQLLEDGKLLDPKMPATDLFAAASHFPGRWIDGPWKAHPTAVVDNFISSGQASAGMEYLERFAAPRDGSSNRDWAESYFLIASALRSQKRFEDAFKAYRTALQYNPSLPRAHRDMGMTLFQLRRYREAVPHLRTLLNARPEDANTRKLLALSLTQSANHEEATGHLQHLVTADPNDVMARLWLGQNYEYLKRPEQAEKHYREAVRKQPKSFLALNQLAWLLATHPDPKVRKPHEAVALARQSAATTDYREPGVLDTLSAAQAAAGDFASALETSEKAIAIYRKANATSLVEALEKKRALYKAGRPFLQEQEDQPAK